MEVEVERGRGKEVESVGDDETTKQDWGDERKGKEGGKKVWDGKSEENMRDQARGEKTDKTSTRQHTRRQLFETRPRLGGHRMPSMQFETKRAEKRNQILADSRQPTRASTM